MTTGNQGFFPWQTPDEEGFRLPWTDRAPAGPSLQDVFGWYDIDPEYLGLTPETYYQMLQSRLSYEVAQDKMTDDNKTALLGQAEKMLREGQFGAGLPLYPDLNKSYYGTIPDGAAALEQDQTMSDYEKAQIEMWMRKSAQERFQADRAQANWERQLEAQQQQFGVQQRQAERTAQRQLRWQQDQTLAGLGGPQDWIKKWTLERSIDQSRDEERARGKLEKASEASDKAYSEYRAAANKKMVSPEERREEMRLEDEYETIRATEREARTSLESSENIRMGTPPSPDWLPQHLIARPHGGRGPDRDRLNPIPQAGEPIEKLQVRTPSGQQWGQTPSSQRQGLAGFAEWAGGRDFGDIYQHMVSMQPQGVAGAQQRRWRPAGQ